MSDWNTGIIEEFRANEGGSAATSRGRRSFCSTRPGPKSGEERVHPMMYQDLGDGSVAVFASKAGAPDNRAWFHNIVANPDVSAEIGADTRTFRARNAAGDDAERIWTKQKADYPGFADYETKTARDPVVSPALSRALVVPCSGLRCSTHTGGKGW